VPAVLAEDGGASGERDGEMMDRWNIEAVLLDMDGTLLDTEKVYCESLLTALTALGYTDGIAALCHSMIGIPAPECEVMLVEHFGKDFPLADLNRAFGAKRDEILYVLGQEDEPCILDRHSPVLHLIQQIRDETHRFAVSFHRQRRGKRQTKTALSDIPGVGPRTIQKLLREFGSIANLQRGGMEKLSRVVSLQIAERILAHLEAPEAASSDR